MQPCIALVYQNHPLSIKSHCIQLQSKHCQFHSKLMMSSEPKLSLDDDLFGAEFKSAPPSSIMASLQDLKPTVDRSKVMKGFDNLRINYLLDSLLVSVLGLTVIWLVAGYKESFSYAVGSALGICYSLLLGRYVERLGTARENKASDGIRFVPVIMLVGLYGKLPNIISIIPELVGFIVSYQLSGFLQMFNSDPYNDSK